MPETYSVAPSFVVEEITGSQRVIELTGRALPYQRVAWATSTRTKVTWYPGNPEATIQVLGPEREPTTATGMWKDRFLPQQVRAQGFTELSDPATVTAEALVRAFESIVIAGNSVRVQWGSVVRVGVLTRITPTWVRPQDVEWEMEFTWSASEATTLRRAADTPRSSRALMREALDENDFALVQRPTSVTQSYAGDVQARIRTQRTQVGQVFRSLQVIGSTPSPIPGQALAQPASQAIGLINAATQLVRDLGEQNRQQLEDLPYTYASVSDQVTDVLVTETWRRTLGGTERDLIFAGLETARRETKQIAPGVLSIVTVPGETSLRQIAATYYGSADDWQRIADANGLVGALVPAGATIVIPPGGAIAV